MIEGLRVDPLPIQINSSQRVSVVATNDSIWIHAWNQNESVEPSQKLCLLSIRNNKIINASEDLATRRLTRVHSRCDEHNLILAHGLGISSYYYLVEGHTTHSFAKLFSGIVYHLVRVIYDDIFLKLIGMYNTLRIYY
jgi:hypothetical protein